MADQVQNSSEPGLPGVTVYLDLNRNGQFDGGEPTQVTAADGSYSFDEPGRRRIRRCADRAERIGTDVSRKSLGPSARLRS